MARTAFAEYGDDEAGRNAWQHPFFDGLTISTQAGQRTYVDYRPSDTMPVGIDERFLSKAQASSLNSYIMTSTTGLERLN